MASPLRAPATINPAVPSPQHTGQNHANHPAAIGGSREAKQRVDGWTVQIFARPLQHAESGATCGPNGPPYGNDQECSLHFTRHYAQYLL
jgi:hypothetical protein